MQGHRPICMIRITCRIDYRGWLGLHRRIQQGYRTRESVSQNTIEYDIRYRNIFTELDTGESRVMNIEAGGCIQQGYCNIWLNEGFNRANQNHRSHKELFENAPRPSRGTNKHHVGGLRIENCRY